MFRVPAVLGVFRVLAFFVVASRVLRNSLAAVGCVAVLAFAMPQVFFSRDVYSELPTQVLLFTALWLLCDEGVLKRAGVLVVAGLSLGFIQAVRIDGLAIVAGLPPIFAVAWVPHRSTGTETARRECDRVCHRSRHRARRRRIRLALSQLAVLLRLAR